MNNISLFIYLHCYGPVYANVTPKLGTAHVTAFQELVVYIVLEVAIENSNLNQCASCDWQWSVDI